eukprot:403343269
MEKQGNKKHKQQKQSKQEEEKKKDKSSKKSSKVQQQQIQPTAQQTECGDSVYEKNGKIFMVIRAKPGSKSDEIFAVEDDYIGVAVQAPPLDGAANEGILEFLASVLGLKKRDLTLVKGSKGHDKLIQIDEPGSLDVDNVLMKLMAAKS